MQHNFTIYCSQVSGKEPKLISEDQTQLLKGFNEFQDSFYQYLKNLQVDSPAYGFIKWVPIYYGIKQLDKIPIIQYNEKVKDQKTKQWLGHLKARYQIRNPQNKFIVLQNISHHFKKPNVLDIKVGTRNQKTKQHKITKTVSQYFFKLNGCRTTLTQLSSSQKNNSTQNQPQTLFFSKYYCKQIIAKEQILQFLAFYFFNGKKIRKQILKSMINQLKQLVLDFSCVTCYRFYSTSICFFCDAFDDSKCELKLLDFGRTQFSTWLKPDQESMIGLQNILKLLIQILENIQLMEKRLIKNIENYKKQNILVVPDRKIKQYEESSTGNE